MGEPLSSRPPLSVYGYWQRYREIRAALATRFPGITPSGSKHKLPLKLGVFFNLIDAGVDPHDAELFLRCYCSGPKYHRAMKAGDWRVDLAGQRVEQVTDLQERYAAAKLRRHEARHGPKVKAKLQMEAA